MSGRVDQAAGLVWRYQDENNYYIVGANALEDNVVLYKVQNVEVCLNGAKLYEVEDGTFTQAGRVGVWTKADSVTHFDDLTVVTKK